jgi:hypothetical protein
MGRPSCQSSLLSDPNVDSSVEMWRRSNIKEGRHVGLDFYDLLIEAHYQRILSDSTGAIFCCDIVATFPLAARCLLRARDGLQLIEF